jgi:hypothetical protein
MNTKETELHSPDKDALLRQLTELNQRGRWYSSQLWQVPFAYLGLTGLAVANATGKNSCYLPLIFWACSAFGVCVLVHMHGMRDGERRAVVNIQETEDALYLKRTVEYKSRTYTVPFQIAVSLAILGYFLAGFFV